MTLAIPTHSPFHPDNREGYLRWREAKLAMHPERVEEILVEIGDPTRLSAAEHQALLDPLRRCNMVIYASAIGADPDKRYPRTLAERFGLGHLDCNYLADDDGLTSITVNPEGDHPNFIPYTNRPIKWHTDGYYNTGPEQIRGMLLHCVVPAASGGENALLDPEILYILLRDESPELVRALMGPEVMSIPPRMDDNGVARDTATGPVYSVDPRGNLHMRYTLRKRNIHWQATPEVGAAVARMEALLESDLPWILRGRLESGMGLLCNNVLHDRAGFTDDPAAPPRLLYRARYFDRIHGSDLDPNLS